MKKKFLTKNFDPIMDYEILKQVLDEYSTRYAFSNYIGCGLKSMIIKYFADKDISQLVSLQCNIANYFENINRKQKELLNNHHLIIYSMLAAGMTNVNHDAFCNWIELVKNGGYYKLSTEEKEKELTNVTPDNALQLLLQQIAPIIIKDDKLYNLLIKRGK